MPQATLSERIHDAFALGGRVAVVFGAAGGLGRESAAVLAEAGAEVFCVELELDAAQATVDQITEAGGVASAYSVDVTNEADVRAMIDGIEAETDGIEILVNAAGMINHGNVVDVTEDAFDAIVSVNVKGTVFACKAVIPHMSARGRGAIVNVASGAIDLPDPGRFAYGITKASVAQFTRDLAVELGPAGIRVNALAPGFFPSKITAKRWTDDQGYIDEGKMLEVRTQFASRQALERLGEPIDQALQVLYLSADASRFVTGQILRANGGLAMPW
jgi:3-oxoacyl-[acyl-carrier protein] reductase